MVKASLSNYRQSPRKVRIVADIVRGKRVDQALVSLGFVTKRGAEPMRKLIESALANAKEILNAEKQDLYIKEFRVDKGVTLKRWMPRAKGRASRINKRSSHIIVVLDLLTNKKNGKKDAVIAEKPAPVEEKTKK